MNQNKQKKHTGHYFDQRVLESYCRQDVKFIFKLCERQAGRRIAKGEPKDDNN